MTLWKHLAAKATVTLFLVACQTIESAPVTPEIPTRVVYPVVETDPVSSAEDAADDPAIWVNPANAAASRILGTNKRAGLGVYDLLGNQVQFLSVGYVNNVDVRQQVQVDAWRGDLAAASNRSGNVISMFSVDPTGQVSDRGAIPVTGVPYGFCMASTNKGVFAIVTHKDGMVRFWQLAYQAEGGFSAELATQLSFGSQLEGCVFDDTTGQFYVGEENNGIWRVQDPFVENPEAKLVDLTGSATGLTADVEGLSIYHGGKRGKYLVASSQGSNRFLVYDLNQNGKAVLHLDIDANAENGMDGVSETDGLAASSSSFGPQFPEGFLVVQDGKNRKPAQNQNFKIIDWRDIAAGLPEPTTH